MKNFFYNVNNFIMICVLIALIVIFGITFAIFIGAFLAFALIVAVIAWAAGAPITVTSKRVDGEKEVIGEIRRFKFIKKESQ